MAIFTNLIDTVSYTKNVIERSLCDFDQEKTICNIIDSKKEEIVNDCDGVTVVNVITNSLDNISNYQEREQIQTKPESSR